MPLMLLKPGEKGIIKRISGKDDIRLHLAELGFVVGSQILVVQAASGALIVQIKDSKIGLDRSLVSKIEVEGNV